MSFVTMALLAFSMSVDAFAVCVGRGAAMSRPPIGEVLRTGAVFGLVEAITPVIGWALGFAASRSVEAVDHWIAFALLGGVGLHMIWSAFASGQERGEPGRSFLVLVVTAIGTSIDAMAVGVSLAFLTVNIVVMALAIGVATFVMASLGLMFGRVIGARFGAIAEICGGVVLCVLGSVILVQHLSA
jgi:putative Mn2+ efflux pump MntP